MIACGICSIGLDDKRFRSKVDGAGRVEVDSPFGIAVSFMDTEAFGRPEGIGVSTSISSCSAASTIGSEEVVNPISRRKRFSSSFSGAK